MAGPGEGGVRVIRLPAGGDVVCPSLSAPVFTAAALGQLTPVREGEKGLMADPPIPPPLSPATTSNLLLTNFTHAVKPKGMDVKSDRTPHNFNLISSVHGGN